MSEKQRREVQGAPEIGSQQAVNELNNSLPLMRELLVATREIESRMNMMEIEHNLCEYDKYERLVSGETKGASFKPRTET